MSRTVTPAPITDSSFWRRLLARLHPDGGGDHELFVWGQALREHVEDGGQLCSGCLRANAGPPPRHRASTEEPPARVPFPTRVNHVELVCHAVDYARTLDGPMAVLLAHLASYRQATSGRGQLAEQRGATYKQARYRAALADVGPREMYSAAERVPMSQAMVGFLITELTERAA